MGEDRILWVRQRGLWRVSGDNMNFGTGRGGILGVLQGSVGFQGQGTLPPSHDACPVRLAPNSLAVSHQGTPPMGGSPLCLQNADPGGGTPPPLCSLHTRSRWCWRPPLRAAHTHSGVAACAPRRFPPPRRPFSPRPPAPPAPRNPGLRTPPGSALPFRSSRRGGGGTWRGRAIFRMNGRKEVGRKTKQKKGWRLGEASWHPRKPPSPRPRQVGGGSEARGAGGGKGEHGGRRGRPVSRTGGSRGLLQKNSKP